MCPWSGCAQKGERASGRGLATWPQLLLQVNVFFAPASTITLLLTVAAALDTGPLSVKPCSPSCSQQQKQLESWANRAGRCQVQSGDPIFRNGGEQESQSCRNGPQNPRVSEWIHQVATRMAAHNLQSIPTPAASQPVLGTPFQHGGDSDQHLTQDAMEKKAADKAAKVLMRGCDCDPSA